LNAYENLQDGATSKALRCWGFKIRRQKNWGRNEILLTDVHRTEKTDRLNPALLLPSCWPHRAWAAGGEGGHQRERRGPREGEA
jgi:hypothetical protein